MKDQYCKYTHADTHTTNENSKMVQTTTDIT